MKHKITTSYQHPSSWEMGTNMFQLAALKDDRGILVADRLGSSLQPPPNRNTMNPWKNKVKRQIPGNKEDTLSKRLWNSPFQYVIFLGAKTELLFNELFLKHQKIYRKPGFLPSKNHVFPWCLFPILSRGTWALPADKAPDVRGAAFNHQYRCVGVHIVFMGIYSMTCMYVYIYNMCVYTCCVYVYI